MTVIHRYPVCRSVKIDGRETIIKDKRMYVFGCEICDTKESDHNFQAAKYKFLFVKLSRDILLKAQEKVHRKLRK